MSQENVEAVRAALDAMAEHGLDGFAEYWTDDIDHRAIEGAVDDRGPMRGKEAVRAYIQDWLDTFDEFTVEPREMIRCGRGPRSSRCCESPDARSSAGEVRERMDAYLEASRAVGLHRQTNGARVGHTG
jgi:hypothetical protein